MTMPRIYQAQNAEDFNNAQELLLEYLTWAIAQTKEVFREEVDVEVIRMRYIVQSVLKTLNATQKVKWAQASKHIWCICS